MLMAIHTNVRRRSFNFHHLKSGLEKLLGNKMSNTNKPDDVETWLLNEATLEEIEKIANE
jgi:hypothetical protein